MSGYSVAVNFQFWFEGSPATCFKLLSYYLENSHLNPTYLSSAAWKLVYVLLFFILQYNIVYSWSDAIKCSNSGLFYIKKDEYWHTLTAIFT